MREKTLKRANELHREILAVDHDLKFMNRNNIVSVQFFCKDSFGISTKDSVEVDALKKQFINFLIDKSIKLNKEFDEL